MSGNFINKLAMKWMGVKQETTFNVAAITDFSGIEQCNIIYTNDGNPAKPTVNNTDFEIVKTLNGSAEPSPEDVKNGRSNWSLLFGGDVKTEHFGFVEQMFRQDATYDVDKMVYKFQPICATNSYTIWVPAGCTAEENGFFMTGCRPVTLTKNVLEGTYTCEIVAAVNHQNPTALEMPSYEDSNYYKATTLANNFPQNTGKLTLSTVEQMTQALEETITYEYSDDVGFYNSEGVETTFQVMNRTIETSFTSTYAKSVLANNQSYTYWRSSLLNTNLTDLGYIMIAGAANTQTAAFQAILSEKDLDTTGDSWQFAGKFTITKSLEDATKDYALDIVDSLNDITLIF